MRFQNVLRDTLAKTANTSVNVRMVACVTDRVAGARVRQAGSGSAVKVVNKNIINILFWDNNIHLYCCVCL